MGNVRLSFTDTNKDGIIQPRQYKVQQCDGPNNPPFEIPNCVDYKPGEIVEVNNYYPFGLLHHYTLTTQNAYQYKYNGKELQETGMYDYGARFYMPDIVRIPQIDPLAGKMPEWSPYSYAFNNPIRNTDPTGMEPEDVIDGGDEESKTLKEPSQCCWGMFRLMPLLEGGSNIKPTVIEVATKTGETAGKTSESLAKTSEGAQKSNERVRYQNEVERAKDKMDGINRAQENLKKSAPQGSKQNAIQSTKKSQQNLTNALRRIDLSNMDEFDVKITPVPIKKIILMFLNHALFHQLPLQRSQRLSRNHSNLQLMIIIEYIHKL